jgi:threonine/homoserine/homoserine lactone efflux protein
MSIDFVGFLAVVLLAYVVPGPDFLVVVRAAAWRASLGRAAALGAQTGLCVHMWAAALGLSVIAARSAYAFTLIKLAGAAYLMYLGVRTLLNARKNAAEPGRPAEHAKDAFHGHGSRGERAASEGHRNSLLQGLLTNAFDPKAALFFLSVLPQFIHQGDDSLAEQVFLLGTLAVVIGIVY